MLLAINIGNTNTTLGVGDAGGWRGQWRLSSTIERTADELRSLVAGLFALDGLAPADVTEVAIASVVPVATPAFHQLARDLFGRAAWIAGPGTRTGLDVRYQPAGALGIDRLLDAVAARALVGAPVVVVDFGTAMTFNVVNAAGAFLGGAIAPGIAVAAEALVSAGARLNALDLFSRPPGTVVGRTTEASVRSGVLYGYAALVDGLLARISADLDGAASSPPPVLATGGLAGAIAPLVPRIARVEPNLTLDGLRLVHAMTQTAA